MQSTELERTPAAQNGGLFYCCADMNLDFDKSGGLITAVMQDHATGPRADGRLHERGSVSQRPSKTGFATFYSRSRQKLWLKGESSGHRLVVKEIATDCDLRRGAGASGSARARASATTATKAASSAASKTASGRSPKQRAYDPAAVYGGKA